MRDDMLRREYAADKVASWQQDCMQMQHKSGAALIWRDR